MNPTEAPPASLEKRSQPGRIRAIFLALAVHAAFFALIVFGITWQSRPAPPVEVELWQKLPAAPARQEAPPKPAEPERPKPEPPKPEEPPPPPPKPPEEKPEPPAKPPETRVDPEIAKKLEREKREMEKRERLEREREKKQKEDAARKKREQEEAAKKKREEEQRQREEERRKREAEKAREAAMAARQSEIDAYRARISAKIRARANVPDTVTGNPEVQVRIRVLPGGEVLDIAITKRSGIPAYDAAIERAIRSASPLPVPDPQSELFPQFRELNLNFTHER